MDIISNLPDNVIDLILEKLPLIDRVKTSILSRSWRLKWTFLPSLILDKYFYVSFRVPRLTPSISFDYTDNKLDAGYSDTVNSLVLQHNGSLKEFSLFIPQNDQSGYSLCSSSIDYVTKCRSLQQLMLSGFHRQGKFALPSSIFSSVSLRHLKIFGFQFKPPSWFAGFPNLTHFTLGSVHSPSDTISHFVSVCPRLEEIKLDDHVYFDQNVHLEAPKLTRLRVSGRFIHVSVSNAPSLISVSMCLKSLSEVNAAKSVDLFKLFDNSAELEQISLCYSFNKFLGRCIVTLTLPRFGRMKVLNFIGVALHDPHSLLCLSSFCVRSPNVEELTISPEALQPEIEQIVEQVYGDLVSIVEMLINGDFGRLVKVNMLEIYGTEIEMKIIELLVRLSPVLERIHVVFCSSVTENAKLECRKSMINFYRASAKVKFYFPQSMTIPPSMFI